MNVFCFIPELKFVPQYLPQYSAFVKLLETLSVQDNQGFIPQIMPVILQSDFQTTLPFKVNSVLSDTGFVGVLFS